MYFRVKKCIALERIFDYYKVCNHSVFQIIANNFGQFRINLKAALSM